MRVQYNIPNGVIYNKHIVIANVTDFNVNDVNLFAKNIQAACESGQTFFPVVINSQGGDVLNMLEMVSRLRDLEKIMPVATIIHSKAMSAAAFLFALGTVGYRYISKDARVMLHSPWSEIKGDMDAIQLKNEALELQKLESFLWKKLSKHIGKPPKYYSELASKQGIDTYFSAREIIKHGLGDYIGVPTYNVNIAITQELE